MDIRERSKIGAATPLVKNLKVSNMKMIKKKFVSNNHSITAAPDIKPPQFNVKPKNQYIEIKNILPA